MKPLAIRFGTGARTSPGWVRGCFVVAVLLCVASLWRLVEMRGEIAALETDVALAAVRTAAAQSPVPRERAVALPTDEIRRLNGVVAQLNLPWGAVLSRIEELGAADVALLALEPGPVPGSIRLVAEAQDVQAMLAFFGRASGPRAFGPGTALVRHEMDPQDAVRAYRFELLLPWEGLR